MVYLSAHIQSVSGIKVWKHSFLLVWKNFTAGTSVYYIQRELRIVISCTDNSSQNHIFFDCLGITGKHRKLLTWIIIQRIDSVFHSLYSCKHGLNHWVRNIPSNELYLKPWWKKKKTWLKSHFLIKCSNITIITVIPYTYMVLHLTSISLCVTKFHLLNFSPKVGTGQKNEETRGQRIR